MRMRPILTVAAMAGVLAVAACEGENLFSVPGNGGVSADLTAPDVSISVPRGDTLSGTALGDSVFVSVHVSDRVGVTSVAITGFSIRGDANLGTEEVVQRYEDKTIALGPGVTDTTLSRYLVAVGDTVREKAYILVVAQDSVGNLAVDTASFSVGGPGVLLSGLVEDSVISAGKPLGAKLLASDAKGVDRLTLEVSGAVSDTVTKFLSPSQLSVEFDTSVAIPATASGPITVVASGRNLLGVIELSDSVHLFIEDLLAPAATIVRPRGDSLSAKPLGDSVLVTAHVTDNFGVRSIRMLGIAQRGDKDLGTDTVVPRYVERAITLPAGVTDTTISRYLRATADSTKEKAQIVVIAADSAGNESSDTVSLFVGGPDVQILPDIVEGQTPKAGQALSIRVAAKDPLGIKLVEIGFAGAFDTTLTVNVNPPLDSILVDTVVQIPADAVGPLEVLATARNTLEVAGQDGPVGLVVITGEAVDSVPPSLRHTASAPDRMEIQDSLLIEVAGTDQGGGVAAVGYTVKAISPSQGDTLVRSDSVLFDPPRTGTVTRSFLVGTFNVDSLSLPDTLTFQVTTWMRDAQGNCAAAVGEESFASLPCDTASIAWADGPGDLVATVAESRLGQSVTRSIVAGKTVLLPAGGRIMDAAVDTVRRRMFLSNIITNRLDVFDLATDHFFPSVGVGSEPWGLSLNRTGDSLWVANSGGTNLSVVDVSSLRESDGARLLTPDVGLFELTLKVGESGAQWIVSDCPVPTGECSFSDRPQFVAVDSFKNVIYSTKTTEAGQKGTARKGFFLPGMQQPEVKLFVDHARLADAEDTWTITHSDGVSEAVADVVITDHVPGQPAQTISASIVAEDPYDGLAQGLDDLRAAGSDVDIRAGKLIYSDFLYEDTTFVAASGDGGWVVVGEGAASPLGRVFTYRAAPGDSTPLTAIRQTVDLLTNASEEVRGVGLNHDGTEGVIRGKLGAYFISPEDLRLQGVVNIPASELGAGAALHPLHADARSLRNPFGGYFPDTHLAFVGSGENTIEIIDTWRFTRIGRVYLRDTVTGPLRAVLPFPEDNAGLTCGTVPVYGRSSIDGSAPRKLLGEAIQLYADPTDFTTPLVNDETITEDRCVVVKLFATTSAGGVVVIDVRKADVFREHPYRP